METGSCKSGPVYVDSLLRHDDDDELSMDDQSEESQPKIIKVKGGESQTRPVHTDY